MAERYIHVALTPLWHGPDGEGLAHATTVYAGEEPDYGTAEVCIQTVVLCDDPADER